MTLDELLEKIGDEELNRELTAEDRYNMLLHSVTSSKETLEDLIAEQPEKTVRRTTMEGAVTAYSSIIETANVYNNTKTYRDVVVGMHELNTKMAKEAQG